MRGLTRNWLFGTGYENGRQHRHHRWRYHLGLENCGSDTSSPIDSSSDYSTQDPVAYRHCVHTSWHGDPFADDIFESQ